METFIDYKGILFTRHEFSYGDMPSPKVIKERRKLADKGSVRIITDEADFDSSTERKKIARKV